MKVASRKRPAAARLLRRSSPPQSRRLDPAGRARGELGTASVIGSEAIRNQTAASLAGILELDLDTPDDLLLAEALNRESVHAD